MLSAESKSSIVVIPTTFVGHLDSVEVIVSREEETITRRRGGMCMRGNSTGDSLSRAENIQRTLEGEAERKKEADIPQWLYHI